MSAKNNKRKTLAASVSLSLPALLCGSEAIADAGTDFEEFPIVASVSRLAQRLSETPAAVTVIDQDMIRASGMRTVEDLLRLVPGFQVTSHNQDPAIVTYHGLTSGMSGNEFGLRVQVLIDGRSQYSPLFKSGVNWNLLPVALENIERIEVTRGPNTVSYGSNAFMGVINIITIDPSLTKGWLLSANHGNNAIRDQTLRWGGGNDDTNIRFTYKSLEDNGFQNGFYNNVWTSAPDSRQSQLFDLRVDKQLTNRDDLQLTLSRARDYSQYGRPGSPINDPIRFLEQTSTSLGIQWRHVVSADEELKLRYAYTEDWAYGPYRVQGNFTDVAGVSVPYRQMYDPGGKSRIHEIEFEHFLSPLAKTRLAWGGGAKTIDLYAPGQFTTAEWKHRDTYRVFGNLEYRPSDPWLFNLGSGLEHDSLNRWLFDWRTGASYHVTPENTLRFVVSRAHRSPSIYEHSGFVQRTALNGEKDTVFYSQGVDAERIDSFELGYFGEFKPLRASADVRAFIERIPNLVQIVPLALPANMADDQESLFGRTQFVRNNTSFPFGRADGAYNLEKVEIRGYEYQLRWRPFESTRLIYSNALMSIRALLTEPGVIADSIGDNIDKIAAQTEKSAPMRSQSAMLVQQLPFSMQVSALYFRASEMRFRRNSTIDPSERVDLRLAKAFKWGGTRGEIAYTMQMINESQQGRYAVRMADQLQWLSLQLAY